MFCEKMYLVISLWDLLLQRYMFLRLENINLFSFTYQQSYQHTNSLISLFLQSEKMQMG